jgi:hypothetical protein
MAILSCDCVACCNVCGETAWILDGTIEQEHDCPAAGRPCEVERCDLCDGSGIMDRGHSHRVECSAWCGCIRCERCEATKKIATPIQGPALPSEPDHPFNNALYKGGPQRGAVEGA